MEFSEVARPITKLHQRLLTSVDGQRLKFLRVVIAIAYIAGMLISRRLWFGGGRTFPRAPAFHGLAATVSKADWTLSVPLLVALILAAFGKRQRPFVIFAVALTGLLVLFDLNRLQPWVYQYALMLAILAFGPQPEKDEPTAIETTISAPILAASQFVIALLYIWSGLQKLNWSFGHEVVPALLDSIRLHLPPVYSALTPFIPTVAVCIAVFETLIGIGLLVRKTRQTAVLLALSMHVILLLVLSSTLRNIVVWPWNLAMIAIVGLLFWRTDNSLADKDCWRWRGLPPKYLLPKVIIVVCGILPVLSFAGWWDMYLSAALYSGNTAIGVVRIDEQTRSQLPETAASLVFSSKKGELMLPLYKWSIVDLNVPPYPEERVFQEITSAVCAFASDQNDIELIVRERPSIIDGNYMVRRTNCTDLRAR